MRTFDDLNLGTSIRNAVDEAGFLHPTPIQSEAFSKIRSGRDVVGIAQTGTGKTIAYLLPILKDFKFSKDNYAKVMILVPTRELVIQVVEEAKLLSKYLTVRVKGVYGGANINTQKYDLLEGVDIVVGTPGRIMDLGLDGSIKMNAIKKLVIDEVDEMLNLGFRTQLKNLIDLLPERRQNLMFSATLTDEVDGMIHDFFVNPEKIEVAIHGTPLDQIKQYRYEVPNYYTKANLLLHLLKQEDLSKVLVFVSSKKMADRLFEKLSETYSEGIGVIHSNKSQNYRFRMVNEFADAKLRILIATDIIARGLDIKEVTHVINFDCPETTSDYMHRIGRTGRADAEGISISFFRPQEEEFLLALKDLMKKDLEIIAFPEEVETIEALIEEEKEVYRMKNYLPQHSIKKSGGAFHQKQAKNMKVNRAQDKRRARMEEKKKARRKKKR
jgi:ATP-dependent RNA helicase RhlE